MTIFAIKAKKVAENTATPIWPGVLTVRLMPDRRVSDTRRIQYISACKYSIHSVYENVKNE